MLKKLRRKFIVTTMLSVVLVLTAIMVTVNAVSYASVIRSADEVVDLLAQNGGSFPERQVLPEREEGGPVGPPPEMTDDKDRYFDLPKDMSMETPFDTRYFYVRCDAQGNCTEIQTDRIVAVDEQKAEEMAKKILSKGSTRGTLGVYRYRVEEANGGKLLIFVNIEKQLEPMKSFLIISLIVMAVCIVLLCGAVFLLSKPILKPIIESYTRQKRFITDAGHELKTPLTIISANNELQEMESGETECTQAISKQVTRMTTMVKNLTELAKMDEQEGTETREFSLSDAFADVAGAFKGVFEKQGKTLQTDCHREIVYKGTEVLIRRLLTLLLENASKYSVTGASVSLIKRARQIVLTVQNDAQGVENGDQSKCFERFYRSDEARATQIEGSGIGLSTAQEIVRLHKGKISAKGVDGQFVVTVIL